MKKEDWLATFLILLISILCLIKVFNLALFGDDFLTIWRYDYFFTNQPRHLINYFNYFLSPYGPQDTFFTVLYHLFGYNSLYYQLVAFVLRELAAFSLFPVVFYLTKSKLASFFAVLFFSVTTIGFDTTNWVFNMASYIDLAVFNLFLIFLFKTHLENLKFLAVALTLFLLSFIFSPIRMTGLLPFAIFFEIALLIRKPRIANLKKTALFIGSFILVMLFIAVIGHSTGPSNDLSSRFNQGTSQIFAALGQKHFDILFYPVVILGSMIIPDLINLHPLPITHKSQLLILFLPYLLFAFALIRLIQKSIRKPFKNFFLIGIVLVIIWTIITGFVYIGNISTFSDPNRMIYLLVGGYVLIIGGVLLTNYFKNESIYMGLSSTLLWTMVSFLPAWYWIPNLIYPTTYRYLIGSALGLSLFLALIISLGKSVKSQLLLFAAFLLLVLIQLNATQTYIDQLLLTHNRQLDRYIWSQMPIITALGKTPQPLIFYLEGDDGRILHDGITFNFEYRMALLYNLWDGNQIPVITTSWPDLISAVGDGKALYTYGKPTIPLPIDNVYSFYLNRQNQLINTTDKTRLKLKALSSKQ